MVQVSNDSLLVVGITGKSSALGMSKPALNQSQTVAGFLGLLFVVLAPRPASLMSLMSKVPDGVGCVTFTS